ncbi:zinc-binding dehydrogenase [Planktothrix agardhii]|uniref:zinc-binding dehydrogenase n=1 Tax=Planktothrix agardhii TaxID=1160 RepID=UPI0020B2B547|nr:zinc-binding dehydrogenase [Planktothrix agardhii]CAD5983040.1 Phthiocerol synthesis polyketide synthase type I PpsC [Planktothrix agardhii]
MDRDLFLSFIQTNKNYAFGLAKVIRLEHPNLASICINFESFNLILPASQKALKPNDSLNQNFQTLLEELENPDEENQIVYRQGVRYVPRLNAYQPDSKTQQSYQLKIANFGTLDHFDFVPLTRKKPGFGEVEIQVRAVGLNFRDVLNGLGMLNQYLEQMGFSNASEIPLGGECSGTIVAVGAGVKHLKIGDEVIAAPALGSLGSYITVNHQFVIPKPTHINFAEAATLSTAFLTAYYALIVQAQLKPGDRILIHAASGGVGQAAIQIAQQMGAEIYATASPGKQEFLKSMGIKFVINSRTLAFADEIRELTNNQGVDVVLNSLNGEFIPKSLEILSPNGRFY